MLRKEIVNNKLIVFSSWESFNTFGILKEKPCIWMHAGYETYADTVRRHLNSPWTHLGVFRQMVAFSNHFGLRIIAQCEVMQLSDSHEKHIVEVKDTYTDRGNTRTADKCATTGKKHEGFEEYFDGIAIEVEV